MGRAWALAVGRDCGWLVPNMSVPQWFGVVSIVRAAASVGSALRLDRDRPRVVEFDEAAAEPRRQGLSVAFIQLNGVGAD